MGWKDKWTEKDMRGYHSALKKKTILSPKNLEDIMVSEITSDAGDK